MRISAKCLAILTVLLLPGTVFAQAVLTGSVHAASGAVLPGVTVEAASPALIEKTRSATTDSSGQYRIIDLQTGSYAVTFTLPGFTTVRRANIELSGTQTVTIPIEMRVGGIAETITVTGETPLVDVQNAKREGVMNLVPKSGGNTFRGTAFFNEAGNWSRGHNLTDDLRAIGLTQTPGIIEAYDASGSFGGPIMKDRLWFYASYRNLDTQTAMEGITANANAGDASRWDWVS